LVERSRRSVGGPSSVKYLFTFCLVFVFSGTALAYLMYRVIFVTGLRCALFSYSLVFVFLSAGVFSRGSEDFSVVFASYCFLERGFGRERESNIFCF